MGGWSEVLHRMCYDQVTCDSHLRQPLGDWMGSIHSPIPPACCSGLERMEWSDMHETFSRMTRRPRHACDASERGEEMKGRGAFPIQTGVSGAMGCQSKDGRRV